MTSADWRTKGRISSPAPNLSPTSFIAGSRMSFRTRTGLSRTPAASSSTSMPSDRENKGQNQLARAELVADFLHRREQDLIQDAHRIVADAGRIQLDLDAFLFAVQNHPMDFLLGRHADGWILFLDLRRCTRTTDIGEVLYESLERIDTLVEHEIVRHLTLRRRDLGVRSDVRRIHDRSIESGLDAVVEEDRIEDAARLERQSEADIGHAKDRRDARQLTLDQSDSLDGLLAGVDPLRIAGRERERQRVVDEIFGGESVLTHDYVVDLPGDLELPLARLRHADLVARERDHPRAGLLDEGHHCIDALAPVLHVDGVDDSAPGYVLECGFDDVSLRRVDDERCLHAHRQQLHHLRHLLRFVRALSERDADVEHVGTGIDLVAGNLENSLVVVGEQQSLHLAGSLRV